MLNSMQISGKINTELYLINDEYGAEKSFIGIYTFF